MMTINVPPHQWNQWFSAVPVALSAALFRTDQYQFTQISRALAGSGWAGDATLHFSAAAPALLSCESV